ncbi:hypothetical protein ES703_53611 [subsurface metagenome]
MNGYLVPVRYLWQWHDIREFIQPENPDVLATYSQIGPDPWALYDFVCRNVDYKFDIGEFWQMPSETLRRGAGDCEDTSILLTSLIRAGGASDCYVALGSLADYGHAWVAHRGQILETTYTSARQATPRGYHLMALFNDIEAIELYPGALDEVFSLRRDEEAKLNLIAKARWQLDEKF